MLGSFVVCAGIARTVLSFSGVSSGTSDLDYTCKNTIPLQTVSAVDLIT